MERLVKNINLTTRALKDVNKIFKFNSKSYGETKATVIEDGIFNRIQVLENPDFDFSKIGKIDESFNHLKREYRKLLFEHYKITYREGSSKIYVVRIFDLRQHPKKNK